MNSIHHASGNRDDNNDDDDDNDNDNGNDDNDRYDNVNKHMHGDTHRSEHVSNTEIDRHPNSLEDKMQNDSYSSELSTSLPPAKRKAG